MTKRAPQLLAESFECPRCGAFAHQEWFNLEYKPDKASKYDWFSDDDDWGASTHHEHSWRASRCAACRDFSVWRGRSLAFPSTTLLTEPAHPKMDPKARELYEEAAGVLPVSRRAAAALARASLEAQLKALGVGTESDRLDARIAHLGDQVTTSLWQTLTVLRDVGNKALHEPDSSGLVAIVLDNSDAELAAFLLAAINEVVEELVAKPARAEELFQSLPEGVRATAELKRAKPLN